MVLLESDMETLKLGDEAKDFTLLGIDDKKHMLGEIATAKANVIIFMCNHCPYVKGIKNRINRLRDKYSKDGLVIIGINSNDADNYPDDNFENMKKYNEEFLVDFYLYDQTQDVARAYGATCTPDIFLFDDTLKLKYHGRIDNGYMEEANATEHELDRAISKTIKKEEIVFEQRPSMGCSIKWKE
jgi:thiol-disulfide isomerase/thioredoxin